AMGPRFINAGVAEQNMVSVAAAMAKEGLETWVYSIAPFCYARSFEQIRNDIAFHGLPVKLIGNGGGYGYGVMGPTHHAIEDYGALRVLPNMRIYLPLTAGDVRQAVDMMARDPLPNYLRLNRPANIPGGAPPFAAWRKIKPGRKC